MKHLLVIALFLNAILVAGRLVQEANTDNVAGAGSGAGSGVGGEFGAGAGQPGPSRNGDVNCDGALDLSDAVGILQFLFNGGSEPCAFAADPRLEDRVAALERSLVRLQDSNRAHHTGLGELSIADLELSGLRVETDITARLSEILAVATASTNVTVEPLVALEFLNATIANIDAVAPVTNLSVRSLNRPRAVGRETDAALTALNVLVDAVNKAVLDTRGGYPQLFAAIALAQSRESSVSAANFLNGMVARNLLNLRDLVEGDEFRAARASFDALVAAWEDELSSVGDDAQLANIDLQNMLQKMQQTLQTMSNVSKMLHDTAMALVRKIG